VTSDSTSLDENSKRTRIEPFFSWLRDNGATHWPQTFLARVEGLAVAIEIGQLVRIAFDVEQRRPASPARLAWMIINAERLAPRDGRRWREYRSRVTENPRRDQALTMLREGRREGIDRRLILEGSTCADCLIECEHAVIWVEGKRNDWLSYGTDWDVTRDQLARNLEAAADYAAELGKEYCLVICHEAALKHHEQLLVDGYRAMTWSGGWPHIDEARRRDFSQRIGTTTWRKLAEEWPVLEQHLN
jgi:hypothetical protein